MADIKVSVICTTFNHVDYLGNAIESFLAQETDFDYEIIIHDDCSTDGTTELLRSYEEKYPGKVIGMYEEKNTYWQNGGRYFGRIMGPVARGKYVAYCEGDDFWCDTHKLQRQYDYMEAHPECEAVTCSSRVIDGTTEEYLGRMGPLGGERDISFEDICLKWGTRTSEGLWNPPMAGFFTFTKSCVDYVNEWTFDTPVGDTANYMYAASRGTVHYFDEDMCIYRYQAKGSWTSYIRRNLSDKKYNWLLEWYEVARIEMSGDVDRATDHRFSDAIDKDIALHSYRLCYTVGPITFAKKYAKVLGEYLTPAQWIKATLVWMYVGVRRVLFKLGIEFVDSPFTGMRVQRARKLVDDEPHFSREAFDDQVHLNR